MDHEMIDTLTGTFKHIIYRSESYMVARFESEEGLITVTGPSFDIEKGTRYELSSSYVDHPRYGFQFQILKVEKALPKVKEDIISLTDSNQRLVSSWPFRYVSSIRGRKVRKI